MLSKQLATVVCASLMLATATAQADSCPDVPLAQEALDAIGQAQDEEENSKTDDPLEGAPATVKVYLHVVRRAPGGEGDMPVAHAKAITVDVLNQSFAAQGTPFRFTLAGIDYLNGSKEEYNLVQNSQAEKDLWEKMHVKGRRSMNVYIVGENPGDTVTGWADFMYAAGINRRGDHVVLRYFPRLGGFGDDTTMVHEAGHWLGLLHPFQFGCGFHGGDLIGDTPAQAKAVWACGQSDTCPEQEGNDPLDNLMGYSDCRSKFSAGQIRRMKFLWKIVRGGKTDEDTDLDAGAGTSSGETGDGGCNSSGTPVGMPIALVILVAALGWGSPRRRRT